MKKYIKFIIPIVLILTLLIALYFVYKKNKDYCYNEVNLKDILYEIDLATNQKFDSSNLEVISEYFLIDYNKFDNFVIGISQNEQEYFAIFKDLDAETINQIEEKAKIKHNNNYIFNTINTYTYVIVSSEYDKTIDGIIRSFIICD